MKRKGFFLGLCVVSLALLFSGCAVPATDLMAGVEAAERPASPPVPATLFTGAVDSFSWTLLLESAKNPGNVLISPASVYLALAMTLNGADSTTRAAMLDALFVPSSLDIKTLNAGCRDWMTLMVKSNQKIDMSIANSIWYRTGFSADQTFLQTNADYFSAGAKILDFSKAQAVQTINDWVKKQTRGTIEKILEQINPAVVMYLINTIYFKADWQTQFEAKYTLDSIFIAPAGDVSAKFMHRTGEMSYLDDNGITGVLLPYADPQYSFFAVLPPEGQTPKQLVAANDGSLLTSLLKQTKKANVELILPRFETKYEDSLINELEKMGMGVAFDSGQADFSLMNTERAKDLFISEVKHKTYCKINEVGTEAAAATVVEISKSSLPIGDYKLEFNRPFLFGILDTLTGLPIFIGILESPVQ